MTKDNKRYIKLSEADSFSITISKPMPAILSFHEIGDDFKETGRSVTISKERGDAYTLSNTIVSFFGELLEEYPEVQKLMKEHGIEYSASEAKERY